jgi:hypothetical protein
MPGCVSLVNFHATREKPLADDQAYRMSSPSKYLKQLCAGCGGLCNGILIIAGWRKNGTLIAKAVVLVGVIVLWGCTPRSSADTSESGRKGFYNYLGSSPHRVGDFGLISYRVEHAGENFQAQVLLVA